MHVGATVLVHGHSIGAGVSGPVKKALPSCDDSVNGHARPALGREPWATWCRRTCRLLRTTRLLEHGRLRVEVSVRPFSFTIRRAGGGCCGPAGRGWPTGRSATSLCSSPRAWSPTRSARRPSAHGRRSLMRADERERVPQLRASTAAAPARRDRAGGDDRVRLDPAGDGEPLRLGLDWDRRAEERLVGLGLRHHPRFDQAGRDIQLGADRRYTGPDCPAEMLAEGGIPQGDCAPLPWLLSSRGYGICAAPTPTAPASTSPGADLGVDARHAGPLRSTDLRRHAGGQPARAVPADRLPHAAARVGLRLLEEPRRSRAPGRRARRLTRAFGATPSRSTRS